MTYVDFLVSFGGVEDVDGSTGGGGGTDELPDILILITPELHHS